MQQPIVLGQIHCLNHFTYFPSSPSAWKITWEKAKSCWFRKKRKVKHYNKPSNPSWFSSSHLPVHKCLCWKEDKFLKEFVFSITDLRGLKVRLTEQCRMEWGRKPKNGPGAILEHMLLEWGQRRRVKGDKSLFKKHLRMPDLEIHLTWAWVSPSPTTASWRFP